MEVISPMGRARTIPASATKEKDADKDALALKTIRISDVVKALEIAAGRLGDAQRSMDTLRAWAAAGRITPAGQVLTPEAVDAGIEKWISMREAGQSPLAASPASKKSGRHPLAGEDNEDNQASAKASKKARSQTTASAPSVSSVAQPTSSSGPASSDIPPQATSSAPKKKRSNDHVDAKDSYAESKRLRQEQENYIKVLTHDRLEDVMEEIGDHMTEILRRTGPEALAQWKAVVDRDACEAERREVYMRLVHAVQDPNVSVPEELCATLLPHQVEGLEWLASLHMNGLHGILADEMGLGKTIQTITLLLHVKERHSNIGPHLIVAPKSTLSNWKKEFARFAPNFKVHVLTGDADKREAEMAKVRKDIEAKVATACITNYEQVHRNEWLTTNKWEMVVVDEGHRLKNPETVLHAAMVKLTCRMRLLLTGTPLQNSLNELWALLHYLLPDLFTELMDFKAWFSNPFKNLPDINQYDVQLDSDQEQKMIARMHALLSPFLLQRLKSEVLADRLPPRVEVTWRVPLSAWQLSAYRDLENKTIRLLGQGDNVTSEQVNCAFMQLRKIVLHPYLFQDDYQKNRNLFRASGKMEALDRLLTKLLRFDHKVLIFSQFTTVLDVLDHFLAWRKIQYVRLDGQVPHEQRARRIEAFNSDPAIKVFTLSARAGGLGLNLQAADTVVLFDLDWNPQNDKQAVARVHRVGQTHEVRVIRLVTETAVEKHMEEVCQDKLEMERKIMGAGMFRKKVPAEQRRNALRAVLGIPVDGEAGSGDKPCGATTSKAVVEGATSLQPSDGDVCGTGGAADAWKEERLTPLAEQNRGLARTEAERKAFDKIDADAVRLPKGAVAAAEAEVAGHDAQVPPLLVRCGRLMCHSEVPAGFNMDAIGED